MSQPEFINNVMNHDIDLKLCLQRYLGDNEHFDDSPFNNILDIDSPYLDIDEIPNNIPPDAQYRYKSLHINIHSIPEKIDMLKEILLKFEEINIEIDFILLCETFLKDHIQHLYRIPGYKLVSRNRQVLGKGGVAIYIRDHISFKIRNDLSVFHEGEFESIFVETTGPNHTIIGEIYRIPNAPEIVSVERFEALLSKIQEISRHNTNIIIGTDQHFDYLKIDKHGNTADLFNSFISSNMVPTITKPTRITHTSATLIDNIYVRHNGNVASICSGIIPYNISDHFPVFAFMGLSKHKTKSRQPLKFQQRLLDENALAEIRHFLSVIDWSYFHDLEVNDACTEFTKSTYFGI